MATITWEGTLPTDAFVAIGGQGKASYTVPRTDGKDHVVNFDLGSLSVDTPIFFSAGSGVRVELGKGSFISTHDTADADIWEFNAQVFAQSNRAISEDQGITVPPGFQTEGVLAASTTGQRCILSGTGKAMITVGGNDYYLALDELKYPFIHTAAITVLPGSLIGHAAVVNSSTSGDINLVGNTHYADSPVVGDAASPRAVVSGQGKFTLTDSTDGISDVVVRSSRTSGFPIQLGTTQGLSTEGTGIIFSTTSTTVA